MAGSVCFAFLAFQLVGFFGWTSGLAAKLMSSRPEQVNSGRRDFFRYAAYLAGRYPFWEPPMDLRLAGFATPDSYEQTVVRYLRLPRIVIGLGVGAALAVAGAAMQATTRDPLADPSILGVNSGAALGVVTAVYLGQLTQPLHFVLVCVRRRHHSGGNCIRIQARSVREAFRQ